MTQRAARYEWDTIAGIIAAVVAIVLNALNLISGNVLSALAVLLIALLFIREVRRDAVSEEMRASLERIEERLGTLHETLRPDTRLIGPQHLRDESEAFARRSRGEMVWFNVCLTMFRPQSLFDAMLRPAIENPAVTAIQFSVDATQQELWQTEVVPKIARCVGREKVREPRWIAVKENSVSFVISGVDSDDADALLSFWGEPFMASAIGPGVPRYIFYVFRHSELIPRLRELERSHRIAR